MRNPYKKLFIDKEKLYFAIHLRRTGWATSSIALICGCFRSSIDPQMQKYGIRPDGKVFTIERIIPDIISKVERKTQWAYIDGERVCLGKSYKDYLSS